MVSQEPDDADKIDAVEFELDQKLKEFELQQEEFEQEWKQVHLITFASFWMTPRIDKSPSHRKSQNM